MMTMTQKILAHYSKRDRVNVGEILSCDVSLTLANDVTAPLATDVFRKTGVKDVFDKERVALVPDHFVPNKDIASAMQVKKMRDFAKEYELPNFFEVGCMGVEHAIIPEKGLAVPGDLIIGADSHTCTYGALGAFSTGVGSTDLGCAMATGKCWFKVPPTIRFNLRGRLNPGVTGKDVILYIIGKIGVDGAAYAAMEFGGDGVKTLSMDDRFTIANMAVEAGAKNGIFEVDDVAMSYARYHSKREPKVFMPDENAEYLAVIDIDLENVPITVAYPHLPSNARTIEQAKKDHIEIDQVVIGSCTNGRLSDMSMAASVLRGRHVAKGVRCIVIPATQQVYKDCIKLGYTDIFIDAGCAVSTPTCGPCLGGHMGILAEGERAVATTNRNFVGRMGHPKSEVYLASPGVAAMSAVAGYITDEIKEDE